MPITTTNKLVRKGVVWHTTFLMVSMCHAMECCTMLYIKLCIVSVLGREEEYTVKYGLSPRDCPGAQPEGNPKGSGLILPHILT